MGLTVLTSLALGAIVGTTLVGVVIVGAGEVLGAGEAVVLEGNAVVGATVVVLEGSGAAEGTGDAVGAGEVDGTTVLLESGSAAVGATEVSSAPTSEERHSKMSNAFLSKIVLLCLMFSLDFSTDSALFNDLTC